MPNVLWLSEDGFDQTFSALRALSRNRVIHSLGDVTLVAQCTLGKGGTWDGTLKNLHHGYSPVCCYRDESEAMEELIRRGATPVDFVQLESLVTLKKTEQNFLE